MRLFSNWVFLAVLLTATGCVSTRHLPLSAEARIKIKDQSLALTQREMPGFGAFGTGNALFGALGGAASLSKGSAILTNNSVPDPTRYIAETIADELAIKFGVIVEDRAETITDSSNHFEVAAIPTSARYLLDVQTVNWGWIYYPTAWSKYQIIYSAKLRLVDAKQKIVIAEGFCAANLDSDSELAPTEEEMLHDNARILKQKSREAADFCISEFRSKTLGIGTQVTQAFGVSFDSAQASTTRSNAQSGRASIEGEWKILDDGSRMDGTRERSGGGVGTWNLSRIP